jgi:putative cofactor-binding repeat protein
MRDVCTSPVQSVLALALLVLAWTAHAATWTVDDDGPADFSSIQQAINAAGNGDTVLVFPGSYHEILSFQQKAITVRAEQGPRVTEVFLEGQNRIVFLDGDSTLTGFTIHGGRARAGGGILVTQGAQATIQGNVIENNTAEKGTGFAGLGGAIEIEQNSEAVITDNVIRGNRAEGDAEGYYGYGGAIDVEDGSTATVTNNLFVDNQASSAGGAISLRDAAGSPSPVVIANNTLVGNRAGREGPNPFSVGGGLSVDVDSLAVIRNNAVTDNSAAFEGGGIYFFANNLNNVTYESNDFDANLPDDCAGVTESKCTGGQLFLPPLYLDPGRGLFDLRSDSELIDRGVASGAPADDIAGRPRPVDGELDGLSDADIGAYENQAEITRLRFDDDTTLRWDGSRNTAMVFDVYRDVLSLFGPGSVGVCWQAGLTGTTVSETDLPPDGDGYAYLVVGRDALVGSLGFDSDGSERTPLVSCP